MQQVEAADEAERNNPHRNAGISAHATLIPWRPEIERGQERSSTEEDKSQDHQPVAAETTEPPRILRSEQCYGQRAAEERCRDQGSGGEYGFGTAARERWRQ